jgi:hypothetical protein
LAFGGDAQQRNNTNRAQNGIDGDCAVVAPGVILIPGVGVVDVKGAAG